MAYDIPSISDLEVIQLLNKHYAEVITSKEGGVSSAADITQTTNPITGVTRRTLYKILDDAQIEHDAQITAHEVEHDNQMQSFENDFDSRLAGMAFTRVGTFTAGATLTDMRQTLLWEVSQGGDGHEYGWTGSFLPSGKVVAAGSTPATSGGVGAGAWSDKTDLMLRSDINIVQKRFACVADMIADTTLSVGKIVETIGYYNDWVATSDTPKGGNRYEIVAAGTGTDDGGSFISLGNGLQAKGLFPNTVINPCQFGMIGNGVSDDSSYIMAAHSYANTKGVHVSYSGVKSFKMRKGDVPVKTTTDFCNAKLIVDWSDLDAGFLSRISTLYTPTNLNDKAVNFPSFFNVINGMSTYTTESTIFHNWLQEEDYKSTSPLYSGDKLVFLTKGVSSKDIIYIKDGSVKEFISPTAVAAETLGESSTWSAYVYQSVANHITVKNLVISQLRRDINSPSNGQVTCIVVKITGENITLKNIGTELIEVTTATTNSIRIPFIAPWYCSGVVMENIKGSPSSAAANIYIIQPTESHNVKYIGCKLGSNAIADYEWTTFSGSGFNKRQSFYDCDLSVYSMHGVTEKMVAHNSSFGKMTVRSESTMVFNDCSILNFERAFEIIPSEISFLAAQRLPVIIFNRCNVDIGKYSTDPSVQLKLRADTAYSSPLELKFIDSNVIFRGVNNHIISDSNSNNGASIGVKISFIRSAIEFPSVVDSNSFIRLLGITKTYVNVNYELYFDNCKIIQPTPFLFTPFGPTGSYSSGTVRVNVNKTDNLSMFLSRPSNIIGYLNMSNSTCQGHRDTFEYFTASNCTFKLIDSLSTNLRMTAGIISTKLFGCYLDCTVPANNTAWWTRVVGDVGTFFGTAGAKVSVYGCEVGAGYTQYITDNPAAKPTAKRGWFNTYSNINDNKCSTTNRPTIGIRLGDKYFDSTLNKWVIWSGTAWTDYMGNAV